MEPGILFTGSDFNLCDKVECTSKYVAYIENLKNEFRECPESWESLLYSVPFIDIISDFFNLIKSK
jgi:hypothetical protein